LNGALVTLAGVAAWNAGTPYVIGDIVVSGGVNYYAIAPGTNHVPPNATFWYAMPTNILELPHGFGSDLPNYSQNERVITLTFPLIKPQELINLGGSTAWAIQTIVTAPKLAPPPAWCSRLARPRAALRLRRHRGRPRLRGDRAERPGHQRGRRRADPRGAACAHLDAARDGRRVLRLRRPLQQRDLWFLGPRRRAVLRRRFVPDFTITPRSLLISSRRRRPARGIDELQQRASSATRRATRRSSSVRAWVPEQLRDLEPAPG